MDHLLESGLLSSSRTLNGLIPTSKSRAEFGTSGVKSPLGFKLRAESKGLGEVN